MVTPRRRHFIQGQFAWIALAILVLTVLERLTAELLFVISFIGLTFLVELTSPFNITPSWRRRLRWLLFVEGVIFTYLVVVRALDVLPNGVI